MIKYLTPFTLAQTTLRQLTMQGACKDTNRHQVPWARSHWRKRIGDLVLTHGECLLETVRTSAHSLIWGSSDSHYTGLHLENLTGRAQVSHRPLCTYAGQISHTWAVVPLPIRGS